MLNDNLHMALYCVLLAAFALAGIVAWRWRRCVKQANAERVMLKVYLGKAWSDAAIDIVPIEDHVWALFMRRPVADLYPAILAAAARRLGIH